MSHESHEKRRQLRAEEKATILRGLLADKIAVSDLYEEYLALKKTWGGLKGQWVPPDVHDQIIDFVHWFTTRTELRACCVLGRPGTHRQ